MSNLNPLGGVESLIKSFVMTAGFSLLSSRGNRQQDAVSVNDYNDLANRANCRHKEATGWIKRLWTMVKLEHEKVRVAEAAILERDTYIDSLQAEIDVLKSNARFAPPALRVVGSGHDRSVAPRP